MPNATRSSRAKGAPAKKHPKAPAETATPEQRVAGLEAQADRIERKLAVLADRMAKRAEQQASKEPTPADPTEQIGSVEGGEQPSALITRAELVELEATARRVEEKLAALVGEQAERAAADLAGTVVQARRFEVVDSRGRVRAVLGDGVAEGGPGLTLLDKAGTDRVTLHFAVADEGESPDSAADEDAGAGLMVASRDHRSVVWISASHDSASVSAMIDGRPSTSLGAEGLRIKDAMGNTRASLHVVDKGGDPRLSFTAGKLFDIESTFGVVDDDDEYAIRPGAFIGFGGAGGQWQLELGAKSDGAPYVEINASTNSSP